MNIPAVVFEADSPNPKAVAGPRKSDFSFAGVPEFYRAHGSNSSVVVYVISVRDADLVSEKFREAVVDRGRKLSAKGLKYYLFFDRERISLVRAYYNKTGKFIAGVCRFLADSYEEGQRGLCIIGLEPEAAQDGGPKVSSLSEGCEVPRLLSDLLKIAEEGAAPMQKAAHVPKEPAAPLVKDVPPEPCGEDEFDINPEIPKEICGNTRSIIQLRRVTAQAAQVDFPVLILGDTGTGKDLVARMIHHCHTWRNQTGSMMTVNCPGIPKELLEAELFGVEKDFPNRGMPLKIGLWELADKGTLFLDEIGDLRLDHQAKILRALQTGEFYRVGGTTPIKVDARVVAATNKDIYSMMENETFREDLYRRFKFIIYTPKLSERREDIPLLAEHHWEKMPYNKGKLSQECKEALKGMSWPGGLREIHQTLDTMFVFHQKEKVFGPGHLERAVLYLAQGRKIHLTPGKETVEGHRNLCLRHLKRTYGAVRHTYYQCRPFFHFNEGPEAADQARRALQGLVEDLEHLCQEPLLFHGHDTCSEVNAFRGKTTFFLGVWQDSRQNAQRFWNKEMKSAFKDIRGTIHREIESLLRG